MKNYRIGKDISFVWKNITLQGEPITSKENLTLEIHKTTGRDLCCNRLVFAVIDGNIVATWFGVYQKELGEYSLTLWANKGKVGESALDSDSVVNLVKSTTLEGGDDSSVETETIEIAGDNIAFAVIKGAKGDIVPVLNKKSNLLYAVKYNALDYDFAKKFFETHYIPASACSVVRKGNKIARNLDWYYDNEVEFIVETDAGLGRHATKGFAGTIAELTSNVVAKGVSEELAKVMPFRLLDGINDAGLMCSVNMVNANETRSIADTGTIPAVEKREEICLAMIARYILDNFATAQEACEYIRDYVRVYAPIVNGSKSELQVFVADKNTSLVLSFEGTNTRILSEEFHGVLTNFRLGDTTLIEGRYAINGSNIEDYGSGVERANIALSMLADAEIFTIINSLHFTHAYDKDSTRYTEFVGINGTTIHSEVSVFKQIQARARELFLATNRDKGDVWHSTHTIVYDLDTLKAEYTTQEINDGNSVSGAFSFADIAMLKEELAKKQDKLVSGENLKTINGNSLLGSGNIEVVTDLSNYYNKPQVDEKVASLRVLSVGEGEKIMKYASSLRELSCLYSLINVTCYINDRVEMLATILPSTDTELGWMYEYVEGWRMCKVSDYEFTANSTFANLCAFLDAHSSKLVTKTLTGEPDSLTTTEKTNLVDAINEVNGKFSNYYSTTESDAKFADKNDTKTKLERLVEKDEYLDGVVHDLTGQVGDVATEVDKKADESKVNDLALKVGDFSDPTHPNVAESIEALEQGGGGSDTELNENVSKALVDINRRMALPVEKIGNAQAESLDMLALPTFCGYQLYIIGTGAPTMTPDFIGQIYIDTSAQKVYMACGVSNSGNFKVLN